MKETKEQKKYYDMVGKVEKISEIAAKLLYFDVILQPNFSFSGDLRDCFVWGCHYRGHKYWANIRRKLESA